MLYALFFPVTTPFLWRRFTVDKTRLLRYCAPMKKRWALFFVAMLLFSSASASRPTVCTVTINSSDEREVFRSHLEKDFDFVELTDFAKSESKDDWFLHSCRQGIRCDVLVISGHFGGSFFGSSGLSLSLEQLQRRSCRSSCDGILKHPREVFLFGCNTTAGKERDHRSPEEYARVLMDDGFPRDRAEMIAAFRYSPIGQETRDRMRQVFPNSRIYGFHSQAPSGAAIAPRLETYFQSVPGRNYQTHLERFPSSDENLLWTKAMTGQWIRSVDGSGNLENPVCILEGDAPLRKKLDWIDRTVSDPETALSHIPLIDLFLGDLEKKFPSREEMPPWEESQLENIQFDLKARELVSPVLENAIDGILSAQVQVLNFAKRIGWYEQKDYMEKLKNLIEKIFEKNLTQEEKDQICSLGVELDLTLADLPQERWNRATITAIECVRPSDPEVHLKLAEFLKDPEEKVRHVAAWVLGKMAPDNPQVHLALVDLLKDPEWIVRYQASWALGRIAPDNPQVHLALAKLLKDPKSYVRVQASWALGKIAPSDPDIIQALTILRDNDPEPYVRKTAAEALESIEAAGSLRRRGSPHSP